MWRERHAVSSNLWRHELRRPDDRLPYLAHDHDHHLLGNVRVIGRRGRLARGKRVRDRDDEWRPLLTLERGRHGLPLCRLTPITPRELTDAVAVSLPAATYLAIRLFRTVTVVEWGTDGRIWRTPLTTGGPTRSI